MAAIPAITGTGVGTALTVGSTLLSTVGAIQSGNAANAAAQFEAKQMDQRALAEQAASQREANEERRQKELVLSRARAVGAASGGGVDYDLMGDIEEEGEFRALTAMWGGDERAAGLRMQADSRRVEGQSRKRASRIQAGATLLGGVGETLYEKYNPNRLD